MQENNKDLLKQDNNNKINYKYDNEHLEYKSKREQKLQKLEEKYNHRPVIILHNLNEEGQKKLIQMKRDKILTTLGWSFIGNVAAILLVQFVDGTDRYKNMKNFKKKEMIKIIMFAGTIAAFTYFGFAKSRQDFVNNKLKLIDDYSISETKK